MLSFAALPNQQAGLPNLPIAAAAVPPSPALAAKTLLPTAVGGATSAPTAQNHLQGNGGVTPITQPLTQAATLMATQQAANPNADNVMLAPLQARRSYESSLARNAMPATTNSAVSTTLRA